MDDDQINLCIRRGSRCRKQTQVEPMHQCRHVILVRGSDSRLHPHDQRALGALRIKRLVRVIVSVTVTNQTGSGVGDETPKGITDDFKALLSPLQAG